MTEVYFVPIFTLMVALGKGGGGRGTGRGLCAVVSFGGALAQLSPVMKRLQEGKVQQVKK